MITHEYFQYFDSPEASNPKIAVPTSTSISSNHRLMRPTTATQLHQQVPALHSREESFEYGRGYIRRLSANPIPIEQVSPIDRANRLLRHTEASLARKDFVESNSNSPLSSGRNSPQRRSSFQESPSVNSRRPSIQDTSLSHRRKSVSLSPPISPRRPSLSSQSLSPPKSRSTVRQTDEESVFAAFAKMSTRAIYNDVISPIGTSLAPSPNKTPRSLSPSDFHQNESSSNSNPNRSNDFIAPEEESVFSAFSKRSSISKNIATDIDSFYGRKT